MKKSIVSLFMALLLSVSVLGILPVSVQAAGAWDGTTTSAPAGNGSSDTPYLVSTAEELAWIAQNVSGKKTIFLTADIDLNGQAWTPICGSGNFQGTFDGKCHSITNFTVSDVDHSGLFGGLSGATVRNLTLDRITVTTTQTNKGFGGALAGFSEGATVKNITVGENTSVTGYNAGGLIGRTGGSLGSISFCQSAATVSTTGTISGEMAGGMVGLCGAVDISFCINTGSVGSVGPITMEQVAGGIAGRFGFSAVGSIKNCFNSGDISTSHTGGGILGSVTLNGCTVEDNASNGTVLAGNKDYTGVIAGRMKNAITLKNCFATASSDFSLQGNNTTSQGNCTLDNTQICIESADLQKIADVKAVIDAAYTEMLKNLEEESRDQDLVIPNPEGITAVDVWDGSVAQGFGGGSGSYDDPFQISTGAQLAKLSKEVTDGTFTGEGYFFALTGNLDLNGMNFPPIGNVDHPFKGTFNGKGYTVYHFNIISTSQAPLVQGAVFGAVFDATVKNLKVDFAAVKVDGNNAHVGGIVAVAKGGLISGCVVGANVKLTASGEGTDIYAGGIAGKVLEHDAVITNCINRSAVKAIGTKNTVGAGGIVGLCSGQTQTKVNYCINYGSVKAGNAVANIIAGGLIANMGSGNGKVALADSANFGNVSAPHTAGGLVGRINVAGNTVSDCYTSGTVSGSADYTGLGIGRTYFSVSLTDCKYLAQTGNTAIGKKNEGLVFSEDASSIEGLNPEDYANTLNPMNTTELQTAMKSLADDVVAEIAALALLAEEKPEKNENSNPSVTTVEPVTESPAAEKNAEEVEKDGGCFNSVSFEYIIFILLPATLIFARKKKKEN